MMRRLLTAMLLAAAAGTASAHWVAPETILARLNADDTRGQLGVDSAVRDQNAPRLLVIRVAEGWYRLPAARRATSAQEWAEAWRDSVAQGIVSILDADTDRPVVRFGPGGGVVSVADAP